MIAWLVSLGFFATIIVVTSVVVAGLWRLTTPWLATMAPRAELRLLQIFAALPLVVFGLSLIATAEWSGREGGEGREHDQYLAPVVAAERGESPNADEALRPLPSRRTGERGEHREGRAYSEGRSYRESREHREGAELTYRIEERSGEWNGGEPAGGEASLLRRVLLGGLVLIGVLFLGRFLLALGRECQGIVVSWRTAGTLRRAATRNEDNYLVLPQDKPEAFVLGLLNPTLFVSQGLLQLPQTTINAVIAHEKAHIKRRDPLRHLLILLACTFHLPRLSQRLHKRSQQVQELVADEIAARAIGDAADIAEALVHCAKLQSDHGRLQLSFNGGDLAERVKTLVSDVPRTGQPDRMLVLLLLLTTVVLAGEVAGIAHHLLEILAR